MQRKPGFPAANCNIKMPDSVPSDNIIHEEDSDQQQRRQQLINFGHSQWGFNNWSWSVSKQELDFVDFANGKYSAGVVAFVSINVKSFEIHRENIGYATCVATIKGSAIYRARKCAVTNALKETLLSFGGSITTELLELLESHKNDLNNQTGTQQNQQNDVLPENNQNLANKLLTTNISIEPKNASTSNTRTIRKDSSDSNSSRDNATVSARSPQNAAIGAPLVKNAVACGPSAPLVAKAHPMPANQPAAKPALPANQPRGPPPPAPAPSLPPAPAPASMPIQPHHIRPNSNVSFVLQPVMGGMVGGLYAPAPAPAAAARVPPSHLYPNAYYECAAAPWHIYDAYERHHANVNLNFNVPPKNLVVNGRAATLECKNTCARPPPPPPDDAHAHPLPHPHPHPHPHSHPHSHYPPPTNQGCWIKPTIFYDGFWTEQKVKKWVAEQVEKQFPENTSSFSASSPAAPASAPSGPADTKS